MISSQAATVTLAHEIGHLFLGPGHDADANNLMYHNLATGTPFVSNSQLALLQAGQWFVSAAAPFVAFAGKPIVIPPIVTAPKRRPRKPSDRVKATRPKKAKGPRTGRARKRTPTKRTLKPADKPAKKPAKKRSSRKKVR